MIKRWFASRRAAGRPHRERVGHPFAVRLLPLLMILLVIFLSYRVERLLAAFGISSFDSRPAHAMEEPPADTNATGGEDAKGERSARDHEAKSGDASSAPSSQEGSSPANAEQGRGLSRSERDLVRDLQARRQSLVERENRLALREQLLAATERRIKGELDELKRIKEEIRSLIADQDARQNEKLKSLVKVYETMKPKDAARIFERLDMKIQLSVARQMKEAKMAALLANMNPDAARKLTTALATPRKIPDLDAILAGKKRTAP